MSMAATVTLSSACGGRSAAGAASAGLSACAISAASSPSVAAAACCEPVPVDHLGELLAAERISMRSNALSRDGCRCATAGLQPGEDSFDAKAFCSCSRGDKHGTVAELLITALPRSSISVGAKLERQHNCRPASATGSPFDPMRYTDSIRVRIRRSNRKLCSLIIQLPDRSIKVSDISGRRKRCACRQLNRFEYLQRC